MNRDIENHLNRSEITFKPDEVTCVVCDSAMYWSDSRCGWFCSQCGNFAYQTLDCKADELYYEYGPEEDYEPIEEVP